MESITETSAKLSEILVVKDDSLGLTSSNINVFLQKINSFMSFYPRNYGYNDILDAISYLNSGITAYKEEAQKFLEWRDNIFILIENNISQYLSTDTPLPDGINSFVGQTGYYEVDIQIPSRNPINFNFNVINAQINSLES